MSALSTKPFHFFENVPVLRTEALSPSMVRIVFGGPELSGFNGGGRDQSLSLFLPGPDQDKPVVPVAEGEEWFTAWRATAPEQRAVMRAYTARAHRCASNGAGVDELDIDFVLHGDTGPATKWAATARPGDRVTILGPVEANNRSVAFRPPEHTDYVLIVADETALPAAASILASLPADTRVLCWLEVPADRDVCDLRTEAHADITWLVHGATARGRVLEAVRAADLPEGRPYAWIAGESKTVRDMRRHLVRDRGIAKSDITFRGYWRMGASEDDLLAE
ncbi:siderophore-interacting protein [Nocardia callitridis]|uniref:Siderophore-interacting protein n=1 Tax=Nocardia callitridis TaxID=648753 RepID=A0ABP9JUI8_9NOCA